MNVKWITFSSCGDARGILVPIEAAKDVPFEIKRVYTLLRLQAGLTRGAHAHRKLQQVIIALAGHCRITLDDGGSREIVVLDNPVRGLCLEPMIWHEMADFSADCVLLVLAADHYDESDYIRDRAEFLRLSEEAGL
jgi:dTDP-4-dehydrorhamnose 3,5-epimerase-like enzyme